MFPVPESYILIRKEEYEYLLKTIEKLSNKINKFSLRIEELESQQRKNSSNSHKPPSSEPLKKVIKNILQMDCLFMQNEQTLEGWLFVHHIALQLYYILYNKRSSLKLISKYSVNDMLMFLGQN